MRGKAVSDAANRHMSIATFFEPMAGRVGTFKIVSG